MIRLFRTMRNPNTMKAYDFLRAKILSGEYAPGAFLSAQSLAKEIGISRTPVREALRQLENDELVTIMPKLGAVVRTLDEKEFLELLGFREALEVFAAGKAAELHRPDELAQLETILKSMKESSNRLLKNADDTSALQRFGLDDQLFHHTILNMSRNDFIRERLERAVTLQRLMMPSLMRKWFPEKKALQERISRVYQEHVDIVAAIRSSDRFKAQACMQKHIGNIVAKLVFPKREVDPVLSESPYSALI